MDNDKSGSLEEGDINRLIDNYAADLGVAPDSDSIAGFRAYVKTWWEMLLAVGDTDAGGTVSFEEYSALFSGMAEAPEQVNEAGQAIFDVLDTDGDGTIGLVEYTRFLRAYDIDDSNADQIFATFDTDGSGSLSRDEFATLWVEFITSDDENAPGNLLYGPF